MTNATMQNPPTPNSSRPTTVIFDIGNVLIGWDPENLYRTLIPDAAARAHFLTHITPYWWNVEQDKGRAWREAVAERAALFPDHAELIAAYDARWEDMLSGPIAGSVALLERLDEAGVPLYAITNFSREKWTIAQKLYPFLARFRDIVVSAHEGVIKPDAAIYEILLKRNALEAQDCLFIDDSPANVEGAKAVGLNAVLFVSPDRLQSDLRAYGHAV